MEASTATVGVFLSVAQDEFAEGEKAKFVPVMIGMCEAEGRDAPGSSEGQVVGLALIFVRIVCSECHPPALASLTY